MMSYGDAAYRAQASWTRSEYFKCAPAACSSDGTFCKTVVVTSDNAGSMLRLRLVGNS